MTEATAFILLKAGGVVNCRGRDNMNITHYPAECSKVCDDCLCPYTHHETWAVYAENEDKTYDGFHSLEEAKEFNRKHLLSYT